MLRRYQLFDGHGQLVHEGAVEVAEGPHYEAVERAVCETASLVAGRQYRAEIAPADDQPTHTHVFDA